MREPLHPEECGPCPECAAYLKARGFTLVEYIGGKPTGLDLLESWGYRVVRRPRKSRPSAVNKVSKTAPVRRSKPARTGPR
jgi:hypothetical protein